MAALTFVQSNAGGGQITTTPSAAFTSNTTGSSFLLCAFSTSAGATVGAVPTDTLLNTWIQVNQVVAAGGGTFTLYVCAKNNAAGGANTVTCHQSAGSNAIALAEFTGQATSSPVDLSSTTSTTATGSSQSFTVVPLTYTNEEVILFAGLWTAAGTLPTAGGGLTAGTGYARGLNNGSGIGMMYGAFASGNQTPAATIAGTNGDVLLSIGVSVFSTTSIFGTVATSTFSPAAGTYSSTQSVTLLNADSAFAGFAQYYTTDGSSPTTGSTLYTTPISVAVSETIKVLAVATNYTSSAIASATYTITASGGGGVAGLSLAMDASVRNSGLRH